MAHELVSDPSFDCKAFVYKQLNEHITKLRERRKSEDWFDFSDENKYLISKIKELWYWRDRLNKKDE